MRSRSVDSGMPRRAAAPLGPLTTQAVCTRASRRYWRSYFFGGEGGGLGLAGAQQNLADLEGMPLGGDDGAKRFMLSRNDTY